MSHLAFVNPGGPVVPDLAKAKAYGITRLYWEARDPQISTGMLQAIRDRKMDVGIMRDPSWNNASALDLARMLDADLVRLGSDNAQCAVLADIEYHDAAYMMAFLHEWRALRPRRMTGWTLEPLQGGWITKDLAAMILQSQVTTFPQTYRGDGSLVNYDLVRSQLVEAGIPRGMVAPVYKATALAASWDGIAYPFHELP